MQNIQINQFNSQQHPFHLVTPSPWPFLIAASLANILTNTVFWFGNLLTSRCLFLFSFILCGLFTFFFAFISWLCDIVREAAVDGRHTLTVQRGLRMGFVLFIISEIMFFFGFFWAFFHSSISPTIWIGCIWPPAGLQLINPWLLPLFNTVILLSSGVSVTWAHMAMINGLMVGTAGDFSINFDFRTFKESKLLVPSEFTLYNEENLSDKSKVAWALLLTITLGALFTFIQLYEYCSASFAINDGIYGSVFYLLTGFHGLHVLIGTVFLLVCYVRNWADHFSHLRHLGFEMAIWYWHFVDVVWIFLFLFVYVWGA